MKKLIILLSAAYLAFCSAQNDSLSSHSHENEAISQENEHKAEDEGHIHEELRVPPERQKKWGIVVGTVENQNTSAQISLPGVLSLNQNKTAYISSFVQGRVESLTVDLGSKVKKGQILITINSPDFARTQADFLRARARLNLSQKEFERAKVLLKESAIEEREFLRREAEYERLSTEYGVLGSTLHSYGITHSQIEELIKKCALIKDDLYKCEIADPLLPIRSPINGTVIHREVIIGEHIKPERVLFVISDLTSLWCILDAYEKDIPFIHKEAEVSIQSSLYSQHFSGRITYVSETLDERLRTVKIRVEVDNKDRLLKPNMYVQGIIKGASEGQGLLVVPEDAIQNLNGEKIVFVPEEENVFKVQHVQIAERIGGQRIITFGLREGDRVVIQGAFALKTELSKAAFGQAHVH